MSRYFTEVEFDMPVDPGAPVQQEEKKFFNVEKLTYAIINIREEFTKIRLGTSNLTPYPIDPGDFSFPAANRLKILETDPSKKNYLAFIEIARQDLGHRAALRFAELLQEAQNE